METIPTSMAYAGAALGGALAAVAYYFVIPDPWSFFGVIYFIAASVIGGCVGWDRGPTQTAEEQRKEHLERWRKHCEREGRM
ncbi:MAG: hypothetical protein F7O42_13720 [Opitutae bacterium]|nr:hypothetical protein [Opitutae bacterium]